ncbi:unnamed protein product [Blepharisma stoltei]|uniref:Chorein N-terminal domain-containing protein n=1 Tax=Blepharisma stoltei TaxID=1481888 RepID=A0AAU9ID54_9CILI|nr:unnamed protein product [Blepharisma stoltei]
MVIKSKIYEILKQYLGDYLYGFQRDQLDVALLSGRIDLVNVNFRPSKVNDLLLSHGLPFHLKAGLIGKLRVKFHYTSIFSNPIVIEIDDLLLIFGPILSEPSEPAHDRLDTFVSDEELSQDDLFESNHTDSSDCDNLGSEEEVPAMPQGTDVRMLKPAQPVYFENEEDSEVFKKPKVAKKIALPEEVKKAPDAAFFQKPQEKKAPEAAYFPKPQEKKGPVQAKQGAQEQRPGKSNHQQNISKTQPSQGKEALPPPPLQPEHREEGLIERYFSKVLMNLTLIVHRVHIRYEDETYPYNHPFAFGISLDNMEVKTASQEWIFDEKQEIKKKTARKNTTIKECKLERFAIYMNSMAGMLIPTSLWEATLHSQIGIFEALPAYEVRDLILQEGEILSNHPTAALLSPVNGSLCITIAQEAPKLKISGIFEKITMRFSSAMAESIRNFFEYFTNVQLWWSIKRYRPSERIITAPRTDFEQRHLIIKRSTIIKKWFQYAFRFIRAKRKLIKYIRARRKEEEKEREREELIRQKTMPRRTEAKTPTPPPIHIQEPAPSSHNNTQKVSFLSNIPSTPQRENKVLSFLGIGKPRQVPGVANTDLSTLVKEYNIKLLNTSATSATQNTPKKKIAEPQIKKQSPKENIVEPKAPQMKENFGEKYFPSAFENSEIDIKSSGGVFVMLDDETMIEWETGVEEIFLSFRIMVNTMTGAILATKIHSGLRDENGQYSFLDLGKLGESKTEMVRDGLFKTLKRQVIETPKEKALDFTFVYRPGEVKYFGESHPHFNKYEIKGKIAPAKLEYKHMFLTHILALYESFQLDKAHRANLDMNYIKKLELKRKSTLGFREKFIKKQKEVAHSAALKKFVLTRKLVKSLVKFQSELKKNLKKIDAKILPISFDWNVELGGLNLAFYDGRALPCSEFFLNKGTIEIVKTEDQIKACAWGIGAVARDSLENLHDYYEGISSIVGDKLKELKATIESLKIYE